jgi:O-antigen/teichoic acid export membrane protein
VSLLSIASFAAIALSIATNKFIAVKAGPEGIALSGLYRSLGAWTSQTLALGYGTLFIRRLASHRDPDSVADVFGAAGLLGVLQAAVVALLALAAAPLAARALFHAADEGAQIWPVRIVFVMALANLLLNTGLSILRGQAHAGPLAAVQLATSASSLALIFPLLRLGNAGLAVNVGSGAAVGAVLACALAWRAYWPDPERLSAARAWAHLRETSGDSLLMAAQTAFTLGAVVLVQSRLGELAGLEALGHYAAALLIVETLVNVLMSSMRTHMLPALGGARGPEERESAYARLLLVGLWTLSAGGLVLGLLAGPALRGFFSARFAAAAPILMIALLSIPGQVLGWGANTYLLHRNRIGPMVAIEAVFSALFLAAALLALRRGLGETGVAWAYAGVFAVWGLGFALWTAREHGPALFGPKIAASALACQAALLAAWALGRAA